MGTPLLGHRHLATQGQVAVRALSDVHVDIENMLLKTTWSEQHWSVVHPLSLRPSSLQNGVVDDSLMCCL